MSAPENPSAFPMAVPGDCMMQPNEGMTLRDWFAGQIAPQILAASMIKEIAVAGIFPNNASLAQAAYDLADAMLAEREKSNG